MESISQCLCVLFDRPPDLEEVGTALERWGPAGRQLSTDGTDGWMACGPGLVLSLRSGTPVVIDVLDRPWPDGADQVTEPAVLEAAWRAGLFGPCSRPGALARAKEQSWAWKEGARDHHAALVRLRTLDDASAGDRAGAGHDPVYKLTALTELASDLLALPGAGALFAPGGEALRGREQVAAALQRKIGVGPPPIELWLNLRAFGAGSWGGERWVLVDIVGMAQLGLPDQEAFFAAGREQPDAVAPMLRAACLRLVEGQGIREGATARDASGRRWRASVAHGLVAPPRPVVRWAPAEDARTAEALEALEARAGDGRGADPQASDQ